MRPTADQLAAMQALKNNPKLAENDPIQYNIYEFYLYDILTVARVANDKIEAANPTKYLGRDKNWKIQSEDQDVKTLGLTDFIEVHAR